MLAMITQHLVHAVQRWELPMPRVFAPRALLASGSSPWAKANVLDAEALEAEGSADMPEGSGRASCGREGATDVPEGPVLHDAEALEAEAAADTPEGSTDPGEIGASALRSSIHGGG